MGLVVRAHSIGKGITEPAWRSKYTTAFPLTQNPISETGTWRSGIDPNQTAVQTSAGIAFGTQTGSNGFDDSSAFLSGFSPNQKVTAVIHKTGSSPNFAEVEILLRWSIGPQYTPGAFGPTQSYGYEINMNSEGAYIQIGQFKGPNLFDSNTSGSPITGLGVNNGDIYTVQIIGLTITAFLTRSGTVTQIAQATDTTGNPFLYGNPGIGFFRQDSGGTIDPTACCFSSATAVSL